MATQSITQDTAASIRISTAGADLGHFKSPLEAIIWAVDEKMVDLVEEKAVMYGPHAGDYSDDVVHTTEQMIDDLKVIYGELNEALKQTPTNRPE